MSRFEFKVIIYSTVTPHEGEEMLHSKNQHNLLPNMQNKVAESTTNTA